MGVLFIGGPLDGEFREIGSDAGRYAVATTEPRQRRDFDDFDFEPSFRREYYHIANGIARHESVQPSDVAARLANFYGQNRDSGSEEARQVADMLEENGETGMAETVRRLADMVGHGTLRKLELTAFGRQLYADCDERELRVLNHRLRSLLEDRRAILT